MYSSDPRRDRKCQRVVDVGFERSDTRSCAAGTAGSIQRALAVAENSARAGGGRRAPGNAVIIDKAEHVSSGRELHHAAVGTVDARIDQEIRVINVCAARVRRRVFGRKDLRIARAGVRS